MLNLIAHFASFIASNASSACFFLWLDEPECPDNLL